MKKCIICDNETTGSIGAAGIRWSCICQPCKDKEDKALEQRLKYEGKVLDLILKAGE